MSPALDAPVIVASDYRAPWWLRNAHLQTLLGTSSVRRGHACRAFAAVQAITREHILEVDDGARLHGLHSARQDVPARGLVLLLHGWEGSAESSYMRFTAAGLLARGFEVFRLNFRDHGDSHHLNEALFHSNRIAEVVQAACAVADMFPARPLFAAGYSLGGNFALRLGLHAPDAGLPLRQIAAVCPVLDPAVTMDTMEDGSGVYARHFRRSWARSLRRKRALYPQQHDYDDDLLKSPLRELTRWLVERHTDYESLDHYFDGYAIGGGRLAGLQVPASLLTSADDPVIPVADFHRLQLPANARLEIASHGGHCGFLRNVRLDGYGEDWVVWTLEAAAVAAAASSAPSLPPQPNAVGPALAAATLSRS